MTKKMIYCILDTEDNQESVANVLLRISSDFLLSLESVSYSNITAILATHSDDPTFDLKSDALRFASVIDAFAKIYTLLPVRYGSLILSSDTALSLIQNNYESLKAALEKVANKDEYSIRVLRAPITSYDGTSYEKIENVNSSIHHSLVGDSVYKQYLQKKYKEHLIDEIQLEHDDTIKNVITAGLENITKYIEYKNLKSPLFILDAAVLVEKDSKENLISFFKKMQGLFPDLNMMLTGPWPPYNFAQMVIK
ncbi:MAG: GvpL/GvpF family gas vesicle protein [Chlorobium sp.]